VQKHNRPVICTEYMARSVGSTFDAILPIASRSTSELSIGASSPAGRKLICHGNHGSTLYCR